MPLERISTLTVKNLRSYSDSKKASYTRLVSQLNSLVDGINQEIDAFNAPENAAHQAEYLASIKAKVKAMDEAQKNEDLECCPDYFKKIQTKLFREIQEEQRRLDTAAGILPTTSPLTLSELIAEMDPDKVNELTSILLNKSEHDLTAALHNLYQPGDAGKAAFDVFLNRHEITVLGGMNSKNFKVVNKDTDEAQVLKVENRMNRNKRAEVQLRNGAISDFFTSLFAERRTYCVDKVTGGMIARSLQVTEFCPGNDIAAHGQSLKDDDELRIISAASVYVRMADILEEMQREGCFFPDMKNSNWLIDSAGQVRNADGKSLEFTNPSGQIEPSVRVLSTPYVTAPEMMQYPTETYSADKAQVYMLTKNLYQYLSSCSHNRFYRQNYFGGPELILDAADLSFAHPIFSTAKGLQFKQLIEDGMKINPADRPSLAEIQARIKVIDPEYAQAEAKQIEIIRGRCEVHLAELEGLVIGSNDTKMADALRLKSNLMNEMQQTPNVQDFIEFEKSLKKAQNEIKEVTSLVQKEIERLNDNAMGAEADLLLQFMYGLSLEERARVMQLDAPETGRLLQLLESIERAEKAQRPGAPDASKLLKLFNQEIEVNIEPERLRKAGDRFSNSLLKLDLIRVASEDSQMEAFILKIYADLGLNPNSREVNAASQIIEGVFSKIEVYARKINTEIEALEDEGMIFLSDTLGKAMSNVPVTERGDIPEGKTAEARRVLEVLALVDEKRQEKAADALRAEEALNAAKADYKDSLSKLEVLQVPLGDREMKEVIEEALLELDSDQTIEEINANTQIALNLLNDIKAVSEAMNLKIETLLALDDEEMQGLGALLAEKMAAVALDQRNDALYEGKSPETRAVLEILTLIDEKGQEKAMDALGTEEALETAKSDFEDSLSKLEALQVPLGDPDMEEAIEELLEELDSDQTIEELRESKQVVLNMFNDIKAVSEAMNLKIKTLLALDDKEMQGLGTLLAEKMAAVTLEQRNDALYEGKTSQTQAVLEILTLIDEKGQEKAMDALGTEEALETAKSDYKDTLLKLEALQVPLGDPYMKAAIEEALLELDDEQTIEELRESKQVVLNVFNDIKAVSEAINLKIETLLALDDEEMRGLGTLLAEKMGAVSFEQRNDALYEGNIPETRAVVEVLTLIDEKGQEKAIQKTQNFKQAVSGLRTNNEADSGEDDVPRLE